MTKVAINRCWGGFGLSNKAFERLLELKGIGYERVEAKHKFHGDDFDYFKEGMVGEDDGYLSYHDYNNQRDDPQLIQVIEEFGEQANGWAAEIVIVEIPDDVEWHIDEYDGMEHVAENHRTWR